MRITAVIITISLTACATFPQLDGTIDDAARDAPYPRLAPLSELVALADDVAQNSQITPASVAQMDDRIAGLRAKAANLRRPVIEAPIRARMRRGVAIPAAIR